MSVPDEFTATSVLSLNNASPGLRARISFTRFLLGQTEPLIRRFCLDETRGNFLLRYSSVSVDVFTFNCFSHFSRMVSIPIRNSQTGRVNVRGKRFSRESSNKM